MRLYSLTRSPSRQVTIQSVPNEVLLNTFRYFLDVSPRDWPRLVHICRKWRYIAFASQRVLRLRLFCTYGTPVQKSVDCWPALPIVVQYGGLPALCPPTPEDEGNIMVALKQFNRVISISLTITPSLLEKLSTIERAFPELQDLVLLSRDGELLTMPSAFRWGQRLRRLHSMGVAFPVHLQSLYLGSSTNLIDLLLHDAFLPWNLSLVILKNLLSEMTRLRSLSLHFRCTNNYHFPLPPNGERVVLPFLSRLDYRGSMAYLEGIFTILDAPSLEDIEITFDKPFPAPKFKRFIDWIETHRSYCGTHLLSSEPTVLMSSKRPGAFMRLRFQSLSKPSLMQISSMAQICLDLSPFLLKNEAHLCISTTQPSERMDKSYSGELLELLNPFIGEKSFHLRLDASHWEKFVRIPQPSRHENVPPPVAKFYIPHPSPCQTLLREAVVSVMISRRLAGRPIEVEYEQPCNINEQRETGTVYDQCKDRCSLTCF